MHQGHGGDQCDPTGPDALVATRWWPAGLAWALWALAILGLAVAVWLDQLLRRIGRPDLLILISTAIPPCSGR